VQVTTTAALRAARLARVKVVLLTREYPPDVYGGAGVHVAHLARELARRVDVEVRCFGPERAADPCAPPVRAYRPWDALAEAPGVLGVLSVDVVMAAGLQSADVVHSHTWYANLAGHLAKLLYGRPHVATTHSLEPLRPWKAEQLGAGGYAVSSFCERTALERADRVIAVSHAMREDVLHCYPEIAPERVVVVHNGVDPDEFRPDPRTDLLDRLGVDASRPLVVFVGRISRQKGIDHLLRAAPELDPAAQLVLRAGSPDTADLAHELHRLAEPARAVRCVVWIERELEKHELVQLLSHASVFVCPSVYEPLGIVNLEAMACEAPVVATDVGGIPEVVDDRRTGLLVAPADPRALAAAINSLLADPARARALGRAGRRRVLARFTWARVAKRTLEVYGGVTCRARAAFPKPGSVAAPMPRAAAGRRIGRQ
jgi:starch synthase